MEVPSLFSLTLKKVKADLSDFHGDRVEVLARIQAIEYIEELALSTQEWLNYYSVSGFVELVTAFISDYAIDMDSVQLRSKSIFAYPNQRIRTRFWYAIHGDPNNFNIPIDVPQLQIGSLHPFPSETLGLIQIEIVFQYNPTAKGDHVTLTFTKQRLSFNNDTGIKRPATRSTTFYNGFFIHNNLPAIALIVWKGTGETHTNKYSKDIIRIPNSEVIHFLGLDR